MKPMDKCQENKASESDDKAIKFNASKDGRRENKVITIVTKDMMVEMKDEQEIYKGNSLQDNVASTSITISTSTTTSTSTRTSTSTSTNTEPSTSTMFVPQKDAIRLLFTFSHCSERFRLAVRPVCVWEPVWFLFSSDLRLGRKVIVL